MKLGPLTVEFHRTVRVAESRTPANLPPSLGRMKPYEVKAYRERCPAIWEDEGVFVGLHDTEALWLSFATSRPLALLVGVGAINALTGQPLGTKLEAGNYLVTPPQPWLDGWKATDGTVYQFVGTPYEKGKGLSVGEQILGEQSQSGGLGLALFESKEPLAVKHPTPQEGWGMEATGDTMSWGGQHVNFGIMGMSTHVAESEPQFRSVIRSASFKEMGVGKGGKITQKVYADPYGLEVWKELPSQTRAVYFVHAELLAEITGTPIAKPVSQGEYQGAWYGLKDEAEGDVAGSETFTGLKSVFADETAAKK